MFVNSYIVPAIYIVTLLLLTNGINENIDSLRKTGLLFYFTNDGHFELFSFSER